MRRSDSRRGRGLAAARPWYNACRVSELGRAAIVRFCGEVQMTGVAPTWIVRAFGLER
jgi:hypothetical protein